MPRPTYLALPAALVATALCTAVTAVAADGAPLRRAAPVAAKAPTGIDLFSIRDDVVALPTAKEVAETAPERGKPYLDADRGASGAVAIVALDETAGGPEYEAFQSVGVPAIVVKSVEQATGYRLMVLAGTLTSTSMSDADFKLVREYVADGGNLIVQAATAYQLQDVIGFDEAIESNKRRTLRFCDGCNVTEDIDTKGEQSVALDTVAQDDEAIGTVGYRVVQDGTATRVATFDDGTAAVVAHRYGNGRVATIGARLLDLVTRHWEGARFSPRRLYANTAASDADVWLLALRSVYQQVSPGGLTLSTSPEATRAALIPTISANWSTGVVDATRYVAALEKVGAPATVFVPTHYVSDWLDSSFFPFPGVPANDDQAATTKAILEMEANGAEVASHSVAHSPSFGQLPLGKGNETAATYRPYVASATETRAATVTGEVRVSRQLLTMFAPRKASDAEALAGVTSFRAGYLLAPRGLTPALDAAGYRYDSTSTQGWVQGGMPFHVPRLDDRGFSNVFEFPITIEDEAKPAFPRRVRAAAATIAANAANGVPSVVLVHPNAGDAKPAAYARLMELSQRTSLEVSPPAGKTDVQPLWIGTLRDYGAFWSQRDQLVLGTYPDAAACKGGTAFVVHNRGDADAEAQSLDVGDDQMTSAMIDGGRVAVNAFHKLALPTIAAGDAVKGELCPASAGVDLSGDWKLNARINDGSWSQDLAAHVVAGPTAGSYVITVDVPEGSASLTAEVVGGGLCLTGPLEQGISGPDSMNCGPIADDATHVGPIPIFDGDGNEVGSISLYR